MIHQDSLPNDSYIFVIDTESYAGNFERALCAYITGEVGECGVGREYAEAFKAETNSTIFEHNISPNMLNTIPVLLQVPDDRGCKRPCCIWDTPGWFNNGMGAHFKDGTPDSVVLEAHAKAIKELAEQYYKNNAKAKADYIARYPSTQVTRFPAYLSVAIFFNSRPTDEQIKLMKERVPSYKPLRSIDGTFNVTGFRLLHVKKKVEFENIPI